jgi:hypothetical protein
MKNTQIHGLTPKGQKHFFSKNNQNCHFLAHEAQMNFFKFFKFFNCNILP